MKKNSDYKKQINPKYYCEISIKGESNNIKILTQEEFKNHDPGIVYFDPKSHKLTFLIKD